MREWDSSPAAHDRLSHSSSFGTWEAPAERIAAALACCTDDLRHLLAGSQLGPGLRPLMRCLEGALDHHLQPGRPPLLPLLLPLLIRGSMDGKPSEATPVGVVSGLLFLCFDLLDDLQDGDHRAWWGELSRAELLLAAAALPSTLPHHLLISLDLLPARKATLVQALCSGLLAVAEGQALDLAAMDTANPDLRTVEASVVGKSGAQMAMYARLSALLAGADAAQCSLWADWAQGLGTAGQLGSDVEDMLHPEWSRDLAAGARTMPITFALSRVEGGERGNLLHMLEQAKRDRAAQLAVLEIVRRSGGVLYTAFRCQLHLGRSRQALDQLDCPDAWRHLLNRLPAARSLDLLFAPGTD